jgi:cytochrome c biogenesis protein CcmG/thiol:disulfide interchange protein DsbE
MKILEEASRSSRAQLFILRLVDMLDNERQIYSTMRDRRRYTLKYCDVALEALVKITDQSRSDYRMLKPGGIEGSGSMSREILFESDEARNEGISKFKEWWAENSDKFISDEDAQALSSVQSDLVGKPAPPFTLRNLDGKEVKLADFKGKVVILDFWATWCPPCVKEIPDYIELYKQYKEQGFEMVGISVDIGADVVKSFVQQHHVNYPMLMADGNVQGSYGGMRAIPTTFVIDKAGKIQRQYVGYRNRSVFEADIKALLAGKSLAQVEPKTSSPTPRPAMGSGLEEKVAKFDRTVAKELLTNLREAGKANIADILQQRIERKIEDVSRRGIGHIIVGRVVVDGPVDPRDVSVQMEILEGGYFAGPVKDLYRPVGFRLHGYVPFNLELEGKEGSIVNVGTIHITPLPVNELASLKGKLILDGNTDSTTADIHLSITHGPVNTPSNGTEGRPRWPDPIKAMILPSGEFSADGFSPTEYYIAFSAPGHVKQSRRLDFEQGKTLDLGTIRLEVPRKIKLTYYVSEELPFDRAEEKHEIIDAGSRWKSVDSIYGWDLEFKQKDGIVTLHYSYAPCKMADLGAGNIADFINIDPTRLRFTPPRGLEPKQGHVYLLDQKHWKHWVLFAPEIEPAPQQGAERRETTSIARPSTSPLIAEAESHLTSDDIDQFSKLWTELLSSGSDFQTQLAEVVALGKEIEPLLFREAVKDRHSRLRAHFVIQQLPFSRDERVAVFKKWLGEASFVDENYLIPMVRHSNMRELTPELIARLESKSWLVKKSAAEALGELGDEGAVKPLEKLLTHEKVGVRAAAARSIEKLTGQPVAFKQDPVDFAPHEPVEGLVVPVADSGVAFSGDRDLLAEMDQWKAFRGRMSVTITDGNNSRTHTFRSGANNAGFFHLGEGSALGCVIGFNGGFGITAVSTEGEELWHYSDIGNVWTTDVRDAASPETVRIACTNAGGTVKIFDGLGNLVQELKGSGYSHSAIWNNPPREQGNLDCERQFVFPASESHTRAGLKRHTCLDSKCRGRIEKG